MKKLQEAANDAELKALLELRDEDIDTSEIPETTDWSKAVSGKFYRPFKEPVTLRLDADVLAWLKSKGPGYQTRVNALLRGCMIGQVAPEHSQKPARRCRLLQFPTLELRGELTTSLHLAELIQKRRCVFAPVA